MLAVTPHSGIAAVKSMHCLDCRSDTHPKLRHPSSMRAEAMVWGVALLMGMSVGLWQAATTTAAAGVPGMSRLSTVTAEPVEQSAAVTHEHEPAPPRTVAVTVGGWLVERLARFIQVAWWALPIPLLFSLWRQFAKRPTCARCGSRRIVAAALFSPGGTG